MRQLIIFLILIISFTGNNSNAQSLSSDVPIANGCGSGWSLYFVPDSIKLAECSFKAACDQHDICYGKCEKSFVGECEYRRCQAGGDLYKNNECKINENLLILMVKANQRKRVCDADLCDKIRKINKGKPICEAFAIVYRDAVRYFGKDKFLGIDGADFNLNQSEKEHLKAIHDFFKNGNEEQFKKLYEFFDSGMPIIDFKKPIIFDDNKGLVNKLN